MSRRVGAIVFLGVVVLAAGVFLTWVSRARVERDRLYCANNLRSLAQFVPQAGAPDRPHAWAVPSGTVPNLELPPERRLSWVVHLLPNFDQKRQDTAALAASIQPALAWDAEPHRSVARTPVAVLQCFGTPAREAGGEYAVTQYVGNGGVAADAPTLPWTDGKPPPTAGCFRYEGPTPADVITDGLSETVLFAEVSTDVGPWLRGGYATVRTIDATRPAVGGQFGGNHIGGANLGFADGRVQFFTSFTDPVVLHKLFTIAGDAAGLPGE